MFKLSLFIIFALHIHNSSCFLDDLDHAGRLLWNVYLILDEISQKNDTNAEKFEQIFNHATVGNEKIKNEMDKIFDKLDEIESSIQKHYLWKISDSLQLLSTKAIQRSRVFRLELCIASIDRSYREFEKYMNGKTKASDDTLDELLGRISVDIEGDITLIRKLIIEENTSNQKNVIKAVTDDAVLVRETMCGYSQLMSTTLVQLLSMVLIAELKTNLMLLIAHIHQYWDEPGWHDMISFIGLQFKKHFASYVNVFAQNMNTTDSLYSRACDPVNGIWTRDKNFFELETIETKIFSYNPDTAESPRCSDAWFNENKQYVSMQYDPRTTCEHTVTGCSDLGAIVFCTLKTDLYRYHYVNSTKLGPLGTNFQCPESDGGFIGQHEGACVCDCTGEENKISLSLMQSRVRSNWVITGLRFFRQDGVLHIQPKEGQLEDNGYISPNTERWIPIPNDTIPHVIEVDSRLFFVEDLRLPPYHVLTGIKFNEVMRGPVSGFAIEIFGIPFDYKSGKCLPSRGLQKSAKALDINGGPNIEFAEVPSNYARVQHTPNPISFGYVLLQRLDLKDDIGRATIPFFDATPIETNPPSVLGGVGIFHKKADGYAGFISLRVFGIEYSQYLLDFQHEAIVNGTVVFDHPRHD